MECDVYIDRICLEHVLEFKYLGCALYESGTDGGECSRKLVSRSRVVGTIRSLVNSRDLQLECAKGLLKTLLVPVLLHVSETLWKERSRIRAVQMDNLRGLLVIRRMDRVVQ